MLLLAVSLLFSSPIATEASAVGYSQVKTAPNSYLQIKKSLLAGDAIGRFDTTELHYKEVGDFIHQVVRETPEIMYYSAARISSNGKIEFTYSAPVSTIKANQTAVQTKVNEVLSTIIKPNFTEFDKVKAVHDYLALTTQYDELNYTNGTVPADSYTAYGALVETVAVCDGYAKAAQLLLNQLGIENDYVDGSANGILHAWNLVKIDGKYYFMDITWDDPTPNKIGYVGYSYFLVTSDQLSLDHSWIKENWPTATSTKYSFFADFGKTIQVDEDYYYSNSSDANKLYKIALDGTQKREINDVRAPYFAISGDWIYFSNYGNGGYLSKMKTDGTFLQQLNSIHSVDISISGSKLHFIDNKTKKEMTLPLAIEEPVVPIGDTVLPTKKWTVTFNKEIDSASISNQNFVVKSNLGTLMKTSVTSNPLNKKQVFVNAPSTGYERNTNYTLTIKDVKSTSKHPLNQIKTHSFFVK